MVSKSDGSVVKVEDLNIGDEILTYLYKVLLMKVLVIGKTIHLINQVVLHNTHQVFKEYCMSFLNSYYNINSGQELITGEHHMLYRQAGNENWTWKTAPNFSSW